MILDNKQLKFMTRTTTTFPVRIGEYHLKTSVESLTLLHLDTTSRAMSVIALAHTVTKIAGS